MSGEIDFNSSKQASRDSLSARLIREIKQFSGLTSEQLSTRLFPDIDLSVDLIEHYAAGSKSMGDQRMCHLAQVAKKNNWPVPVVEDAFFWSQLNRDGLRSEFKELARDERKSVKRDGKSAFNQMDKAISNLVSLGWNDAEIVAITVALTEKNIQPENRTLGGHVDYSDIRQRAGLSNEPASSCAWISWKIQSMADMPGV